MIFGGPKIGAVHRAGKWWTKKSERWTENAAQSTAPGNRGPNFTTVDEKSARSTAPERMAPDLAASHRVNLTATPSDCPADSTNTKHTGSLKAGSLWHGGCHR
jgi:hypothetical protein